MTARRRALRLSYFTVGYNALEAALSILFGTAAGSAALLGFGLDSVAESLSGLVMIWRLSRRGADREAEEATERRAERLIGASFLALGAYVLYESVAKLWLAEAPRVSLPGVAIACASLLVMPWLAHRKLALSTAMGSRALAADAKETLFCATLSAALLAGLLLNWLAGLWQADPAAGLVIVVFLFREGLEGLRGEA